ncbi:hypothetical protein JD844_017692 [Phrynosoma platyrhinos]|uniref:GH18 domain-containing protein n=1 Tax=Phrynosoma platyrhinos TaxID=52577 RepID=A0ABQ7SMB9_PHRPL|nr:hypothetical protein JD844_017692 [Phrynosoma platyrhinos]
MKSLNRAVFVFVFDVGGKTWKFYDWSQITTVAIFGQYDSELMCYAHSKGSRVVLKGDISEKEIILPARRAAWIKQKIETAKNQHMDGINIDIEQRVKRKSPEYYALTALVKETTEAFHKEIPGSQVTFDVSWSPECINHDRCYNYTGIADSCDFVFVMSYDEGRYESYIRMGISPKKLVMGVPWYGYDYTCLDLSKCIGITEVVSLQAHVCSFAKLVTQRLPCSKASGHQVSYKIIMNWEKNSLSGVLWDKEQKAPYLEYKDSNGTFHQVWFDDPRSISLKAAYVKEHGLRGIGMWHANCLDYSRGSVAQEQTKVMWEALKPK